MKTISIIRIACVALLLMAGLPSAQAQGIRVHYKNGNTVDVPASLFDHMSPSDINQTNPAYIIYKTDVLSGATMPTIEAGYTYTIKIIVGLESVKFDVTVTPWDETTPDSQIGLPENH